VTDKARRDLEVTEEHVWNEHLEKVNAPLHWLYMWTVLIGGFLLMLGLIAWLGTKGA
jgi:hypothetical protein